MINFFLKERGTDPYSLTAHVEYRWSVEIIDLNNYTIHMLPRIAEIRSVGRGWTKRPTSTQYMKKKM